MKQLSLTVCLVISVQHLRQVKFPPNFIQPVFRTSSLANRSATRLKLEKKVKRIDAAQLIYFAVLKATDRLLASLFLSTWPPVAVLSCSSAKSDERVKYVFELACIILP